MINCDGLHYQLQNQSIFFVLSAIFVLFRQHKDQCDSIKDVIFVLNRDLTIIMLDKAVNGTILTINLIIVQ